MFKLLFTLLWLIALPCILTATSLYARIGWTAIAFIGLFFEKFSSRMFGAVCVAAAFYAGQTMVPAMLNVDTYQPKVKVEDRFFNSPKVKAHPLLPVAEAEISRLGMLFSQPLLFGGTLQRGFDLFLKTTATYTGCNLQNISSQGLVELVQDRSSKFEYNHYYEIVPTVALDRSKGIFVFNHGAMGNFKIYTCLLTELAEELRQVIVVPSRGVGPCDPEASAEFISKIVDAAADRNAISSDNHVLMGLSNGNCGVLAAADPDFSRAQFARSRLILSSPVLPKPLINNVRNAEILVLTGEDDKQTDFEYVKQGVNDLKKAGADVTFHHFPKEDHFLMLSNWRELLPIIKNWLE
ncbi:hypothetical protein JNK13_01780 [bacterium]|nr:hypothetical protein [bacterium]